MKFATHVKLLLIALLVMALAPVAVEATAIVQEEAAQPLISVDLIQALILLVGGAITSWTISAVKDERGEGFRNLVDRYPRVFVLLGSAVVAFIESLTFLNLDWPAIAAATVATFLAATGTFHVITKPIADGEW